MSASSKKKLRKELAAEANAEKQHIEKKEQKKDRAYTITFIVVMALVLLIVVATVVVQAVNNSGIIDRNTTALTVNNRKISSAELSYFYIDTINTTYSNWQNTYGDYTSFYIQLMYGLDMTKSLADQVQDEQTGTTWADFFVNIAVEDATSIYALCDQAGAEGFTLTQEQSDNISSSIEELRTYVTQTGGFSSLKAYLKALYGNGAREDTFRAYQEAVTLASSYQQAHSDSLQYNDEQIAAYDSEHTAELNSYSYAYYYLTASQFREGGTTDESGSTTYTDEEIAAGVEKCKAVADSLLGAKSVELFDAGIAGLEINKDNDDAHSTHRENYLYSSVSSVDTKLIDWVTNSARKAGEMTVIPNEVTATAEDGTESTTIQGYYVVYMEGVRDNTMPLANVRHILIAFSGGTTDSSGTTTYSDEEKAAAKEKAEQVLAEWKAGDATEDSFAALATEKSDDTGSAAAGGLYEDITPDTNFVEPFLDWCFAGHKAGDTEIIETTYGYHVMYYVGDDEMTYRHYMIDDTLRSNDLTAWHDAIVDAAAVTLGNTSHLERDLILSSSGS